MTIESNQVLVRFGNNFSSEVQGYALLALEQLLRDAGIPALVLKETMRDQNVLRRLAMKDDL